MIDTEIRGKTPVFENKEDILTSNVFGLLGLMDYKYLPKLLDHARNLENNALEFGNLIKGFKVRDLKLWKPFDSQWGKYEEPDVYVEFYNGEETKTVIIEIKYTSGESIKQSNSQKVGQLKRYIEAAGADYLIYLTASYLSVKNLQEDNLEYKGRIFHIHWETLAQKVKEIAEDEEGIQKNILRKLTDYLDFKGFTSWQRWNMDFLNITPKECKGSFFHPSYFHFNLEHIDTNVTGGFYAEK